MDLPDRADDRPLADVTLIESLAGDPPLCLRLACGLAGRIAADLGARVIVLEPAAGDPVRGLGPWVVPPQGQRISALHAFLSCGKSLLRLPARRTDEALRTLLGGRVDGVLAAGGDPAIELARGMGVDAVQVVGFPVEGPGTDAPLTEFGVFAWSGMLDMIGDPAREPLRLGGHQASYAAGMSAFTAMMALLAGRQAGRAADVARVSLIETLAWVNWKAVSAAQATGRSPSRRGAKAEFQVMRCQDGWIALVFTVTQYDALVRLIGDPVLSDPRFATRAGRTEHAEAFIAALAPWFAARRRDDIYREAQALGVPLGPVLDAGELLNDPQHLARAFVASVVHPDAGALRVPRLPVRWGTRDLVPEPARESSFEQARLACRSSEAR